MQINIETHRPKITKLVGGGASWFYAICSCGKILGSAHQDDRNKMKELHEIKCREVKYEN